MLGILWIFGILIIWIKEIQIYFLNFNLYVYPELLSLNDIIYAFVTLLAILPAVTLTAATIAVSWYGYKTLGHFKKDRYFWGSIFLFLSNILIPYSYKIYDIQDLRILASIELTAFLSFLFIIPYFLATFNNIIFEKIMKKFVDKINRDNLIQSSFKSAQSIDISKDDLSLSVFNMLNLTIRNRDLEGFSIIMENYSQKIQNIINDIRKKPLKKHPIKDDGLEKILNPHGLESHNTGITISNIAENVFQRHIEDISNVAFKYRDEGILIDIVKNIEFLTTNTWDDLKRIDYPTNDTFWMNGTIKIITLGEKACSYDMPDLIARCLDSQSNMGIFWAKNSTNSMNYLLHRNYSWHCQLNIISIFNSYVKINRRHNNFIIPRVLYNESELLIMRLIYQPRIINSNDFDDFFKIIKKIIDNKIHTLVNFDAYFEKIIIPVLLNVESQRNINKTVALIDLIFTLFLSPYKIVVECQNELLKNKRNQDNTLILDYNPQEWYNQIILLIRNTFHISIENNYDLSQLNLYDLYVKLLIIFIRIEEWVRVEELINEVNNLNKMLKKNTKQMINPLHTFEQILYVLLHLGKKELFIKTINFLEEDSRANSKSSKLIFKMFASIGIFCYKWSKTEELLKVISLMLNISFSSPELERELDTVQESYDFSLDEGFFLTHTIKANRKESFSTNDKSTFKKLYYLEKIKRAKRQLDIIKNIAGL